MSDNLCFVCKKREVEPLWDITCKECGDDWHRFVHSDGRERTLEHEIVDFSIEWSAQRAREELQPEIARLRAENERLNGLLEADDSIIPALMEDIAQIRKSALIWHKWPEEKPTNSESYKWLAMDIKTREIYFKGARPIHWLEDDEFLWAEIPIPKEAGDDR